MQGAMIFYVPDAVVYHYVPKEHATRGYLLQRFYAFGASDAVRQQLDYPNDVVDWAKRIVKGLFALMKNLLTFVIKLPQRLLFRPNAILVDGVGVVFAIGYLAEEMLFFMRLFTSANR